MTRQPDQRLVPGPSQNRGLAGLDGDTVQQELSERFDDAAGRVLHTGTAAAGEDHRVAAFQRITDGFMQQSFIIRDDPVLHRLRAEFAQQSRKHRHVHIPHLSGAGRLGGRHQLVSGGEHAHLETGPYRNLRLPDRGKRTDILGAQHLA